MEQFAEDRMRFDLARDATPPTPFTTIPSLHACDAARPAGIVRHDARSPLRPLLEDFVRREFFEHFNARVRHFMPELLALHGTEGRVRAVVGCRAAAVEPLFLETYTREPIEAALAARNGFFVPRERIVEIGSLACRNATAAIAIVRALVPYLLQAGFTWVVFTGADTVMNVFHYLGLAPRALCAADPLLLGEARHDWGTYYDHSPHVMAGPIRDGARASDPRSARKPQ